LRRDKKTLAKSRRIIRTRALKEKKREGKKAKEEGSPSFIFEDASSVNQKEQIVEIYGRIIQNERELKEIRIDR
jgi:ribosome-binding protein aMBF1 (putative translation factor)